MDVRSVLRGSVLLGGLSDEDLDKLIAVATERSFPDGAMLAETGSDRNVGMWVILEGNVDVSRDGRHLNTLGPGDHVGEMALVSDIRRTADVVAKGDVRTLQLNRWDFRGLIVEHPDIMLAIMGAMAERLAQQNASD
jgi:CRP-like cAMP-binding protein